MNMNDSYYEYALAREDSMTVVTVPTRSYEKIKSICEGWNRKMTGKFIIVRRLIMKWEVIDDQV